MFTASVREKALNDRRARFIGYIKAGLRLPEIAEREGVDERYAKQVRKEIASAEGLSIAENPPPSVEERARLLPFGLTSSSNSLRGRLGSVVYKHTEINGMHPVDLAAKTGVNQKALKSSWSNPSIHDWSLSQIERLAALEGKDFVTFMRELLKP